MQVKGKRGSYKESKSIQHKHRQLVIEKLDRIIELLETPAGTVKVPADFYNGTSPRGQTI